MLFAADVLRCEQLQGLHRTWRDR